MDEQPRTPTAGKGSYASPEFRIYGDLTQITATVGKNGMTDGGTNANGKNFTIA